MHCINLCNLDCHWWLNHIACQTITIHLYHGSGGNPAGDHSYQRINVCLFYLWHYECISGLNQRNGVLHPSDALYLDWSLSDEDCLVSDNLCLVSNGNGTICLLSGYLGVGGDRTGCQLFLCKKTDKAIFLLTTAKRMIILANYTNILIKR